MAYEPKVAEVTDMTCTQVGKVTGHWGKGIIKRMCFSIVKKKKIRGGKLR